MIPCGSGLVCFVTVCGVVCCLCGFCVTFVLLFVLLTGLVGFCDLGFCGGMGFDLLLRGVFIYGWFVLYTSIC